MREIVCLHVLEDLLDVWEALWQPQSQHDQKLNSPIHTDQKILHEVNPPWCYHTGFFVFTAGYAFEDIFKKNRK